MDKEWWEHIANELHEDTYERRQQAWQTLKASFGKLEAEAIYRQDRIDELEAERDELRKVMGLSAKRRW